MQNKACLNITATAYGELFFLLRLFLAVSGQKSSSLALSSSASSNLLITSVSSSISSSSSGSSLAELSVFLKAMV